MNCDRGSSLIEILVGGGLVVALLVGLIVGSARLQWAAEIAFAAASVAATTTAVDGSEAGESAGLTVAPDASITIHIVDGTAVAEVAVLVRVVGFGGLVINHTVTASSSEPLSPMRSRP